MTTAHGALVKLIMREVGKIPDTLIFKRFTGNLWTRDGTMIQSSVPGQCDLWGITTPRDLWGMSLPAEVLLPGARRPIHFEIEVKVGKDRLNKHQLAWQETCARLNVPHYVAHAASSDRAELERVAKETASWLSKL